MALDLKEKLGPLPVWAWALIGVATALVAWKLYGARSTASTAGAMNTQLDTTASDAATQGYATAGLQAPTTTVTPTVSNNTVWLANASRNVADALGASPSMVSAALQKYLSGQTISSREQTFVDKAISLNMSPPEGTQGTSTVYNGAADDKNAQIVNELYLKILGRPASASTLAFYSQALANGAPVSQIEATIAHTG